jgi:hypothetical protein
LVKVFVSYSHRDENLRIAIEKHLSLMKNQGVIDVWHDRRIEAGQEFAGTIDRNLSDSQIILLLVSSDFLASAYCFGIEMNLAMQRHESGDARVIPIILRACDWHSAPFGKLTAAPRDGEPVTLWPDLDKALYDVALKIRSVVASFGPVVIPEPTSPDPARQIEPQNIRSTRITPIYCSRCGAPAGAQSVCTGSYTHHSFVKAGRFGAYCSRCGVVPGDKTDCTGSYTHHDFVDARGSVAFCRRCGVFAGKRTECTGSYTHHEFSV